MAQFMLLLQESPQEFAGASPDEMQRIVEEYVAWRSRLESEGRLVGGNKLTDEGGRHLSGGNGSLRVVDGPYSEAKEVIGGYFIIEAENYDQAVELCQDCPHLKYGERIEVRAIQQIHP